MRSTSASASVLPARWRNSSTSFSKRSISFWRSVSFERSRGGAPALFFSFALIPAPFERRACHKSRGPLPPIPAWFSRAAALVARRQNRPESTVRTRPGRVPAKRQTNLPNGRELLRSGIAIRFEREARRIWRASRSNRIAIPERRSSRPFGRFVCRFAGTLPGRVRTVLSGRFCRRATSAAARENHAGIGGSGPRDLWQARRSNGAEMRAKEKNKAGAPPRDRSKENERQKEIERLEKDVEELRHLAGNTEADAEVERIRQQVAELRREFYTHLGPWQRAQIARHQQRPYTLDFIGLLFTDFMELHGDRGYADDKAIITGLGKFHGRPVAIVGHQKGRDTKQRLVRNFGQPKPEGYRKALRVMQLAAKFGRPIFTFIDTPGAYPGIDAEERGQGEAIARNLREMSRLPVPVIVTVTGEGGSGGALAIAVGDRVNILENSFYSVISPEGCASIIWRDSTKAE